MAILLQPTLPKIEIEDLVTIRKTQTPFLFIHGPLIHTQIIGNLESNFSKLCFVIP